MSKSPGSRRGRSLGYFTFVMDNNFFVISSRLVGARPAIAVSAFSQEHADARTAPQVSNGMVGVLKVSGTVARMLSVSIGFYVQPPVQFVQALAHPG